MPSYGKFVEEILSNKRKLDKYETIALIEERSSAFQNKLPAKLKDPRSFQFPNWYGMYLQTKLYVI